MIEEVEGPASNNTDSKHTGMCIKTTAMLAFGLQEKEITNCKLYFLAKVTNILYSL